VAPLPVQNQENGVVYRMTSGEVATNWEQVSARAFTENG